MYVVFIQGVHNHKKDEHVFIQLIVCLWLEKKSINAWSMRCDDTKRGPSITKVFHHWSNVTISCWLNKAKSNYCYSKFLRNFLHEVLFLYQLNFFLLKKFIYLPDFFKGHLESYKMLLLRPMGICQKCSFFFSLFFFFYIFWCFVFVKSQQMVKFMSIIILMILISCFGLAIFCNIPSLLMLAYCGIC